MSDDEPDEFGKLLAEVTDDPQLALRMRRAIERNRDLLDRIAGLS
jgi:hypothetical protein